QLPKPFALLIFSLSSHPTTITAHTNPSGLVFFCLQVWVHAGLWRLLRTVETMGQGGKKQGFVSGGG
ncbi:hypothetical protein, partial [Zwartia sp.]|uniref:hypothetical protein n=1 Tax=Zwartia sp. TaxID=2978004 RepID=UPI003BB01AB8